MKISMNDFFAEYLMENNKELSFVVKMFESIKELCYEVAYGPLGLMDDEERETYLNSVIMEMFDKLFNREEE